MLLEPSLVEEPLLPEEVLWSDGNRTLGTKAIPSILVQVFLGLLLQAFVVLFVVYYGVESQVFGLLDVEDELE